MNIYADGGGHADAPVFGASKRNGRPHAKRIFGNIQQQISSASSSAASMFSPNSSSVTNNGQHKQSQNSSVPEKTVASQGQHQQGQANKGNT